MRDRIPEVVGMLQREVAERLAAPAPVAGTTVS